MKYMNKVTNVFFSIFNIYWYVFKKQGKNQVTYSLVKRLFKIYNAGKI